VNAIFGERSAALNCAAVLADHIRRGSASGHFALERLKSTPQLAQNLFSCAEIIPAVGPSIAENISKCCARPRAIVCAAADNT
jgi:hypothetical protein